MKFKYLGFFALVLSWLLLPFSWDYVEGVLAWHQIEFAQGILYSKSGDGHFALYGPLYYLLSFWSPQQAPFLAGRLLSVGAFLALCFLWKVPWKEGVFFVLIQPALWYFAFNNRVDLPAAALCLIAVFDRKRWLLYLGAWIKPTVALPFLLYFFLMEKPQGKVSLLFGVLLNLGLFFGVDFLLQGEISNALLLGNVNKWKMISTTLLLEWIPYAILALGFVFWNRSQSKTTTLTIHLFFWNFLFASLFLFKEGSNINYFIPLALLVLALKDEIMNFPKGVPIVFIMGLLGLTCFRLNLVYEKWGDFQEYKELLQTRGVKVLSDETSWVLLTGNQPQVVDIHMLRQHEYNRGVLCSEHLMTRIQYERFSSIWPENFNKKLISCDYVNVAQGEVFNYWTRKK